jgi:hypothetical protein
MSPVSVCAGSALTSARKSARAGLVAEAEARPRAHLARRQAPCATDLRRAALGDGDGAVDRADGVLVVKLIEEPPRLVEQHLGVGGLHGLAVQRGEERQSADH